MNDSPQTSSGGFGHDDSGRPVRNRRKGRTSTRSRTSEIRRPDEVWHEFHRLATEQADRYPWARGAEVLLELGYPFGDAAKLGEDGVIEHSLIMTRGDSIPAIRIRRSCDGSRDSYGVDPEDLPALHRYLAAGIKGKEDLAAKLDEISREIQRNLGHPGDSYWAVTQGAWGQRKRELAQASMFDPTHELPPGMKAARAAHDAQVPPTEFLRMITPLTIELAEKGDRVLWQTDGPKAVVSDVLARFGYDDESVRSGGGVSSLPQELRDALSRSLLELCPDVPRFVETVDPFEDDKGSES